MAKVTPPDQIRLQESPSAAYSAEEGHPSLKALAALLGRTAAREHWNSQLLPTEAPETASAGTPGLIPASAPEVPGSESEADQASVPGAVLPDLDP